MKPPQSQERRGQNPRIPLTFLLQLLIWVWDEVFSHLFWQREGISHLAHLVSLALAIPFVPAPFHLCELAACASTLCVHCLILTFIPGRGTGGSRVRILSGTVNCFSLILPPVLRRKTSAAPAPSRVCCSVKVSRDLFGKKRYLLSHTESVQPVMAHSF